MCTMLGMLCHSLRNNCKLHCRRCDWVCKQLTKICYVWRGSMQHAGQTLNNYLYRIFFTVHSEDRMRSYAIFTTAELLWYKLFFLLLYMFFKCSKISKTHTLRNDSKHSGTGSGQAGVEMLRPLINANSWDGLSLRRNRHLCLFFHVLSFWATE